MSAIRVVVARALVVLLIGGLVAPPAWAGKKKPVDGMTAPDGSPNPLAMPEPFEDAAMRYKRAICQGISCFG